ncbi:hypothetical protein C3L33_15353, partial [Rhododendron williamsianum]
MEGVGARLGRSSTRYGPTSTVFNGPVRKWKKKWVSPPSSNNNNNASSNHHHSHQSSTNNNSNGSSHLLLYKWTPISQSQNGNSNNNNSNGDKSSPQHDAAVEEPPRRKFKYIPIAVLEEQRNEAEDEAKASDKPDINNGLDDKPDINDVPMEESQLPDDTPLARQDLNVSTLDLSLGLKASDGDADSDE